jgi:drug/metabolite transporter (DMT)-like permease
VGVAIMSQQDELSGSFISIALVLSGCFAWALGQVMIRKLKDSFRNASYGLDSSFCCSTIIFNVSNIREWANRSS